jgi:hypothetical protein
MSYRIYISHSLKDLELAKDLARRLAEAGIEVLPFVTEADTNSGRRAMILQRVRDSNEVIVLLTDNSADNSADGFWVRYAMGAADSIDKRLTPVVVNEGVEQRVPMVGKHFIRYAELPKYISALKRRVKAA